ncbi:hypothetical protein CH272_26230 [Rhodococcus sp. 05-340-1]|nr:hypothetical protein CH271_11415 [Rhodococcus sp. 05-340-2]OZD70164.1 hypothetical protein CH272_26230 [Rhodococcus sp. 05-340-1]
MIDCRYDATVLDRGGYRDPLLVDHSCTEAHNIEFRELLDLSLYIVEYDVDNTSGYQVTQVTGGLP